LRLAWRSTNHSHVEECIHRPIQLWRHVVRGLFVASLVVAAFGCEGMALDEGPVGGVTPVGLHGDAGAAPGCVPVCDGLTAGPDGCGGECGEAPDGPLPGCVPSCLDSVCGDDGCGGSCGRCDEGLACMDGACECAPRVQQVCCELGASTCWVDGCGQLGKTIEGCSDGCVEGACCTPSCKGRLCGDDGCGGTCGGCEGELACVDGACGCAPAASFACCEDGAAVCSYDSCGHLEGAVEACALGCLDGSCCGHCAEGHLCTADGSCVCGDLGTACPDGFACEGGHCVGGQDDEVYVPAGVFVMGCTAAAGGACAMRPEEMPRHTVTLPAFAMDRHEVSVMTYKQCVTTQGCSLPLISAGAGANYTAPSKQAHPVNFVKWSQAADYCERQDKRLCSAAEWEMAGRGSCSDSCEPGDFECCEAMMPIFPWGDWEPDCAQANHGNMDCGGGTAPVGSYPEGASPYGALDLAGNVWEWVQDCWHDDYTSAPVDGVAWEEDFGLCASDKRVIRGGSYDYGADSLRLAKRLANNPKFGADSVGFRCCRGLTD
jgi:formylglycine-generating enzyme required for sulfatase activity